MKLWDLRFLALVLIAGLGSARMASAQIIPQERLVDWTPGVSVGVPGGIERFLPGGANQRTNLIDVTKPPYNADKTGSANAAPAIQAAIESAPAGSVVYLPPGRYRCDSGIGFGPNKDNVTLRGAGKTLTVIESRSANAAFVFGSASDYDWKWPGTANRVTAGLAKGSTNLTIADTTQFGIGQLAMVVVQNEQDTSRIQSGVPPVVHVSNFPNVRRQLVRVVAKSSASLTIFPPLYHDFGAGRLDVTVNVARMQTDFSGVESLTIDCSKGQVIWAIQFEQAYGCWARDVKVIKPANYPLFLYDSLNCEVRRCELLERAGAGSNGAGVLCNSSSACLIEDNIIYKHFPLVEVNQGSCGNVFAYNLMEDSSVFGGLGSGLNSNHGPHNSHNLYEGNVCPNIQADGYFGSVSEDTVFRNWFHGTVYTGSYFGFLVSLNRFCRNYSLVGNILGTTNWPHGNNPYSFGNPNMGNSSSTGTAQPTTGKYWADWERMKSALPGGGPGPAGFQELDLDVGKSTTLKANYFAVSGQIPSGETLNGTQLPDSLFRSSKPMWWPDTLAWPPFNPLTIDRSKLKLTNDFIPAQTAFRNNGVWSAGDSKSVKITTGLRIVETNGLPTGQ